VAARRLMKPYIAYRSSVPAVSVAICAPAIAARRSILVCCLIGGSVVEAHRLTGPSGLKFNRNE
jgi:hypothetical protein